LPFPLPEGAWIAQARPLRSFACDAAFHIAPSIYVGPDNGMTPLEWATANVRLPPVMLPRQFPDEATTMEVLDREDALIGHYRRILQVTEQHGKAASLQPFPYFRTQPAIIADDTVLTEFSWTDDIPETRTVLEILAQSGGAAPGLLHDDQDQGWRILIVARDGSIVFIEWEGEGPPLADGGYAVDSAELARQAGAALERLRIIHERLVLALGRDYWSYRYSPPLARPTNGLRRIIARIFGRSSGSRPG
jgi:hypothetical protein